MRSIIVSVSNLQKKIVVLTIVLLAIYLSWATTTDSFNILLIGFMAMMPLVWMVIAKIKKQDLALVLLSILLVLNPLLIAPETYRASTIFYSFMFFGLFITYRVILSKDHLNIIDYKNILKFIIYSYFFILVFQQISVLLGLPIINESAYSPQAPFKLNSLASEPAIAGRVLSVIMYSFLLMVDHIELQQIKSKDNIHEVKIVWIMFIWCMLTMGSGTAVIFFMIVLFASIKKSIMPIFLLAASIFFPILILFGVFDRPFAFLQVIISGDIQQIIAVDTSAASRVVPHFIVASNLEIFSINGVFGNGVDYTGNFIHDVMPMLEEGTTGGGMFQIWLEYGLLAFLIFLFYTFLVCNSRHQKLGVFFWFMLIFMYGINSSLVWLTMVLLSTNKYFFKKKV